MYSEQISQRPGLVENDETIDNIQTGLGVLQSGLTEQGFGIVIPSPDTEPQDYPDRLSSPIRAVTAIAMGSLALAAPLAILENPDQAMSASTESSTANQVDYVKVVPGLFRRINAHCGIEPFKFSARKGTLERFFVVIISSHAPTPRDQIVHKVVPVLGQNAAKVPIKICNPDTAELVIAAKTEPDIFQRYNFNWSKKKWIQKGRTSLFGH